MSAQFENNIDQSQSSNSSKLSANILALSQIMIRYRRLLLFAQITQDKVAVSCAPDAVSQFYVKALLHKPGRSQQ